MRQAVESARMGWGLCTVCGSSFGGVKGRDQVRQLGTDQEIADELRMPGELGEDGDRNPVLRVGNQVAEAIRVLFSATHASAEGAGAAALAALLEHPQRFAGKRVGLTLSGGNIDSRVLASVLMRGLVRDSRLVRLRVTMPDVSGSLAKVAALIAEAGGNIVEVLHQRIFGTASVRAPEVEFLIETRDREHTDALLRSLQDKGIKVLMS